MPEHQPELDYAELNGERIFLENLLQQRFNFFIVTFSLIMAAGTAADSPSQLDFVLSVGFSLCLLHGFCVYRVFVKVDAALRLLHDFKERSMDKVAQFATQKWPLSFRVNDLMGYVIPLFSLAVIALWAVLANMRVIHVT